MGKRGIRMAEMQSGAAPMLLAARPRKDVLSRDGSIPKRRGGNMVSRILSVPETGKKKWCGRWDLNPHGLAACGFSYRLRLSPPRRSAIGAEAGLRSGLSLHLFPVL